MSPEPMPLTAAERAVLDVLEMHAEEPLEGCGEYVPVKRLAEETGLHWREVQEAVSCLVINHKQQIGHSTKSSDPGNKLLEPEEVDEECDKLDRRATKIFVRKAALRRTSVEHELARFGQLKLWKEDAA